MTYNVLQLYEGFAITYKHTITIVVITIITTFVKK